MFGLSKYTLTDEQQLEVETNIALLFSNHIIMNQHDRMLTESLNNMLSLAENVNNIPKGYTVTMSTLKHGEISITHERDGKFTIKKHQSFIDCL